MSVSTYSLRAGARLGGFVVVAALLAGGAYGVGRSTGPIGMGAMGSAPGHGGMPGAGPATPGAERGELPAGGLQTAQDGYRFQLLSGDATAGHSADVAFRILGPDGTPVTRFTPTHEKRMHLITVRRDLSGFQHLHPVMSPDGTWRVPITFPAAGDYRAFADFDAEGSTEPVTLGTDVAVAGDYTPAGLPAPARRATLGGGYAVDLAGDLVPGRTSKLTLTVSRNGRPVTDLQPYLGAYGHLVALRDGDLAYLHVHPDGAPGDGRTAPGPQITFFAEVPSAGDYRLFLDFQHEGEVRTAGFTATTQRQQTSPPEPTPGGGQQAPAEPGHGDHEEGR